MYENGGRVILREPVCASESSFLSDMTDSLPPQKTLLAHIRFATVGSINENNCHPFTGTDNSGREWTLIHNGTIFRGRHNHRYAAIQSGDTDSERFFLSLLDTMNEHISRSVPGERERFEIVSRFIAENAPRNKLNLIIYDGDMLYVHKNLKNTLCSQWRRSSPTSTDTRSIAATATRAHSCRRSTTSRLWTQCIYEV